MIFIDPNCAIIESLRRITFVQKKRDVKVVVNPQSSSVIITDKCDNGGIMVIVPVIYFVLKIKCCI